MKKRSKRFTSGGLMSENEDTLKAYLRDIDSIPLLSREEEEIIACEAARGSKSAKDKLINSNLRFVVRVAKKYQGQGLSLPDLISEGNIGLIRAARNFDSERGYHFISYAVWWIRQAIIMAIIEKARVIRMPVLWNKKLYRMQNEGQKTPDTENIQPPNDENHKRLIMLGQDVLSLEQPLNDNENSVTLGDLIVNENDISPEDSAINSTLHDDLLKMLETLDKKEAEILSARYGIMDNQPKSLEELGDCFQISKEGIRQIENRAIKHLRESEMKDRLASYVA